LGKQPSTRSAKRAWSSSAPTVSNCSYPPPRRSLQPL
jgi:hypothetical protein